MSFKIWNESPRIPVVANIPHDSSVIPAWARSAFVVSDEKLNEELRLLTDWFTAELYNPIIEAGGWAIVSEVSRFVVDMERFDDDEKEVMASRGMGVLYTHGCHKELIRDIPNLEYRERILSTLYRPYHAALTDAVTAALDRFGRVTVIDCHSYPEHPLPYELDPASPRADIVLGTDPHHTPPEVVDRIATLTERHGYSFACDKPFAGTYVPLDYYRDSRVTAFMLEINRRTYMDERSTEKKSSFAGVQALIREIVTLTA